MKQSLSLFSFSRLLLYEPAECSRLENDATKYTLREKRRKAKMEILFVELEVDVKTFEDSLKSFFLL